jgi:hypothetical protein
MAKKQELPHIQAAIDKRRDIVASLVARGMRQTEITAQLAAQYIKKRVDGRMVEFENPSYMVNPETNQPYDKSQINRDVAWLKAEWRKAAKVASEEFFAAQLAELQEARRVMWAKGDMHGVTNNLALEIKLTGTALPEKKEVELGPETRKLFTKDELEDLTDEQLAAIATRRGGGSG